MRHCNRKLQIGAGLLGGLLLPALAAGQESGAESQPVSTPSVLIILDSSGSMDFTSVPDTVPSVCVDPTSLPLGAPPEYVSVAVGIDGYAFDAYEFNSGYLSTNWSALQRA